MQGTHHTQNIPLAPTFRNSRFAEEKVILIAVSKIDAMDMVLLSIKFKLVVDLRIPNEGLPKPAKKGIDPKLKTFVGTVVVDISAKVTFPDPAFVGNFGWCPVQPITLKGGDNGFFSFKRVDLNT